MGACPVELAFLHRAESGFVVLHSLCKNRVLSHSFFWRGLVSHWQDSSCLFRNYTCLLNLSPASNWLPGSTTTVALCSDLRRLRVRMSARQLSPGALGLIHLGGGTQIYPP